MAGSKTGAGTSKAGAAKKAAAKKSESAKAAAKRSESKGAKGAKRRAGAGADPAAADAGAPSRPVETGEGPGSPQTLARTVPVRAGEQPWTVEEIIELRAELDHDIRRAMTDLRNAEEDLQGLIWDAGNGSGDDQADAGAKTYEREQELSLANISRDKLEQSRHALVRLDQGRYGVCENCGEPIGKFRLQAAPRATLCRSCKEKTERL
ncbi:MAG: TraR/DksA C4-type zinc finger protein [Actinomycetales bacterium]|nr:TraR/DksA C4-type zinc finger protein [Actinomycetales bacterium]HMT32927.1 TraR/DksA C4-type zinc finger protein [Dermatophilaceae bacterium]